jgi:Fe/S biogenesis protein NfuA
MITITEAARKKVSELRERDERSNLALHVAIRGRGPGGFLYDLQFVKEGDQRPDDVLLALGQFNVYLDAESVPQLRGSTLDYIDGIHESGFHFENPNPLWTDPLAQQVQEVIDTRINPAIASHGGFVTLLDVQEDTAYIQMGGGCQGCGMANVTLKQGVEVMIQEAVPQITKVIDATDHAAGTNPFYQPSKGD